METEILLQEILDVVQQQQYLVEKIVVWSEVILLIGKVVVAFWAIYLVYRFIRWFSG